ncbi:MAG: hypothetical protein ABI042_03425 [Verrucomicrobiota bacterium]
MNYEVLLWIVFPVVVALVAVISSLVVTWRTRRVVYRVLQFVASLFVLLVVAVSLLFLYWMFAGKAYLEYEPYWGIGAGVIIVITQMFLFRSQRHDVA